MFIAGAIILAVFAFVSAGTALTACLEGEAGIACLATFSLVVAVTALFLMAFGYNHVYAHDKKITKITNQNVLSTCHLRGGHLIAGHCIKGTELK